MLQNLIQFFVASHFSLYITFSLCCHRGSVACTIKLINTMEMIEKRLVKIVEKILFCTSHGNVARI